MKKRKFSLLMIASSMTLGLLMASCGGGNDKPGEGGGDKPTPTPDPEIVLPEKYDLMNNWAGHMEEEFYNVTLANGKMTIDYTDVVGEHAGGWAYVNRAFAYDAAKLPKFGEYKKISFTGKMETTAGSSTVMIKFQGGTNLEKKFTFGPEERTYEFGISTIEDWNTMEGLYLFANRDTNENGSGVMTFSDIHLSKEAVNPDLDIAPGNPTIPQSVNFYSGQESLDVMTSWGYDDKGAIKTEAVEGGYKFSYGDGSKETEEWAYVSARIKGTEGHELKDSGFKRIHFEVKGTKGTNALVKLEGMSGLGAKEFMIADLTGDWEEYDLNIADLITKTHEDGKEVEFKAMVFPAAGRKGADLAGEVMLRKCTLDKTDAVDPNAKYWNHRDGETIPVTVIQNNEPVYTITSEGTNHTIAYDLAAPDWKAMKILNVGEKLEELNCLSVKVTSTAAVKVLFKPYNAMEKFVDLEAGVAQELKINFDGKIAKEKVETAIFIGVPGSPVEEGKHLTGTVTLENLHFEKAVETPEPPVPPVETDVNVPTEDGNNIYIDKFVNVNEDFYKVTNNPDTHVTTIDFDKTAGGDWDNFQFKVKAENINDYTTLKAKITSSVKTTMIIKAYDNNEIKYEENPDAGMTAIPANEPVEISKELAVIDPNKNGFVFIGFTDAAGCAKKGTLTIEGLRLERPKYLNPNANVPSVDGSRLPITKLYNYNTDLYTITSEGTKHTIEFNKKPEHGWIGIQFMLAAKDQKQLATFDSFTFKVTSTVSTALIVKPFDFWRNEAKFENADAEFGVLPANEPKVVTKALTNDGPDFNKDGFIFIGFAGETVGTMTIENFELTCSPANNPNANKLAADGKTVYIDKFVTERPDLFEITNDAEAHKTTIAFDKPNRADDWANITWLTTGFAKEDTITLMGTITSTVKTSLIIKAFDGNELKWENTTALPANEPVEINKLLENPDLAKNGFIMIAFNQDNGSLPTGTITLDNFRLVK